MAKVCPPLQLYFLDTLKRKMKHNMAQRPFSESRVKRFGDRLVDMMNGASLALMTSVGHRTGLFDTMSDMPPATSQTIAETGGLDERYVREWLAAMVTGGFIEYDPAHATYYLPPEHAALLTRKSERENAAVGAQYVSIFGSVEDRIIECFRNGGGVSYDEFPRVHEVVAEDSAQSVLPDLVDKILPIAPGIVQRLEHGIDVLEVGCGSGRALNLLSQRFPESRFTGYDISLEAIAAGRRLAEADGNVNVRFEAQDAARIAEEDAYDLALTFDAIHDQADPQTVLARVAASLRQDGLYLMQDIAGSSELHHNIGRPLAPTLYTYSTLHCMTVSLAQGGLGLGTMWGRETAVRMLKAAGFEHVEVRELEHNEQKIFYLATK